ncbi:MULTISPECIES: tRNA uridine-5-carboxymethylaminomethyl(34) synthesis GTPase MnmE [Acidobacteriaceae]|uniref:tRNA uridine-5-carboxymethylaminomethyl(34) synthesis GTPase MnmE n=1 Tax=Acidobacteriaceae TaxID=204434 RepID=UPI00131A6C8A|nr:MULTISPECIES: tRNA uridine-5-carboxymethylaminomethyl(34) synthesis GTPase MnmE [Acidobacteriaceae]MDW5265613.1 tRNA uridine-5-carboxymethylaminomethyl(34) synthesis GTPase MnmE [Edaphobacter sp.]
MSDNDTIVAISTPPGRGGIGIVRLSGPSARAIAEPLLRLRHPLAAGQARFAEILDIEKKDKTPLLRKESIVLDEAVVTYFAAPNSYTAEDIVEIAAHGSPVLLDYLVRTCIANGARLAEPGEFTQRAFLAGRLDLTQAEAVHDLIESTTLHQARVAAQQLGGALSRQVAPIKEKLVHLIASLEAGIDFAEDDIDLLPASAITAQIQAIEVPLASLEKTFSYGRIVRDGFTLTIVGRPNAGKSSLFNRLVERDRAIVTATPGTTRDLVTERVSLEGIPLELVDTAGLRDAADEAETIGIAKSREAMAEADIVLLVLDATAPLHPEDEAAIAAHTTRPLLIARNKHDLAPGTSLPNQHHRVLQTSALTGEGIAELRRAILALITTAAPSSETALLTNLRQQQAVSTTLAALARARTAVAAAIPHEMLLLDLYEALQSLDSLTGVTTTDDILHLIFSTFCIGK